MPQKLKPIIKPEPEPTFLDSIFGQSKSAPPSPLFAQQSLYAGSPLLSNKIAPHAAVAKPGPHLTPLDGPMEHAFQQWVKTNNVPFDPSPESDYDMRGFFKGLITGDPRAVSGVNPYDKQLHFTDAWKTPFHESFSNESMYATPDAPRWINDHQLADASGKVVYDERKAKR